MLTSLVFMSSLYEYILISDGKCQYEDGSVKTEDVLQFITGCSSIPPGGFDSNFTIHFTNDKCYPTVSTCSFDITLPLHLGDYNKFKEVMIESIISGPGFGLI